MNNNILDIKFGPSHPCTKLHNNLCKIWTDLLDGKNEVQELHDSIKLIDIDFNYDIKNSPFSHNNINDTQPIQYPKINISKAEEIYNFVADIFVKSYNVAAKTFNDIDSDLDVQYIAFNKLSHFPNDVYPVKEIVVYINKISAQVKVFIENILKISDILHTLKSNMDLHIDDSIMSGGGGKLFDARNKIIDIKQKLNFLLNNRPFGDTAIQQHTNFDSVEEMISVLNKFKTKIETYTNETNLEYFDINLDATNLPTEVIKSFSNTQPQDEIYFNNPQYDIKNNITKIDEKIKEYDGIISTIKTKNANILKNKNKYDKILNIDNMNYTESDFTFIETNEKYKSIASLKGTLVTIEESIKKEQFELVLFNDSKELIKKNKENYKNISEEYSKVLGIIEGLKLESGIKKNPTHNYIIGSELTDVLSKANQTIKKSVLTKIEYYISDIKEFYLGTGLKGTVKGNKILQTLADLGINNPDEKNMFDGFKELLIIGTDNIENLEDTESNDGTEGTDGTKKGTGSAKMGTSTTKNAKDIKKDTKNTENKTTTTLEKLQTMSVAMSGYSCLKVENKKKFTDSDITLQKSLTTYISFVNNTKKFNKHLEQFKTAEITKFIETSERIQMAPFIGFVEKYDEYMQDIVKSIADKNKEFNAISERIKEAQEKSDTDNNVFNSIANNLYEKLQKLNNDLASNYNKLNEIRKLFNYDIKTDKILDLLTIDDNTLNGKWYAIGGSRDIVTEQNLGQVINKTNVDYEKITSRVTSLIYKLNELKEVSQDYIKNIMTLLYINEDVIFYIFYLITLINDIKNKKYVIPQQLSLDYVKSICPAIENNNFRYLAGSKKRMMGFSDILKKILGNGNNKLHLVPDASKKSYIDILMFSHMGHMGEF